MLGNLLQIKHQDLLLIPNFVRGMKGSKRKIVNVQILEKAANLGPYIGGPSYEEGRVWGDKLTYYFATRKVKHVVEKKPRDQI